MGLSRIVLLRDWAHPAYGLAKAVLWGNSLIRFSFTGFMTCGCPAHCTCASRGAP
jgi:hypothetical protein